MKFKVFFLFLTTVFMLTGCNYEFRETPSPNGNSNTTAANDKKPADNSATTAENKSTTPAPEEETGPLIFSGTSETAVRPCNGREVEFDEESTANNITLTGECKKVTVDGVSNTVSLEKVGEIIVKGASNKVTYTEGLDGKKPKITKGGTSSGVTSRAELEKKKAEEK